MVSFKLKLLFASPVKTVAGCDRAPGWLNKDENVVEWEPLADVVRYQGCEVADALVDRALAAQRCC